MAEETAKLSIAESLYGSPEDKTPKADSEPAKKEEPKAEEKIEPKAEEKTPSKEGHVEDEAKPPSKEEAAKVESSSDLDWMDKAPPQSHSDDGEAKESKDKDVEIEYNGRKIKVSDLQQEAKNLESGYTTKTMELADKRKSLDDQLSATEVQKTELATSLTEVENFLKTIVQQEPDWEKLKETLDTEDILLKRMEFTEHKENLKKVSHQKDILAQDQMKKKANEEIGILVRDYFPEWKDSKKCEAHITSVFSGAEKFYNYKTDESKHIMLDNRLFRVMADAVNWRKHKAAQKKIAENKSPDTPPKSARASEDKLDTKPGEKVKKVSMAESLYPQYSKKPAGVT